MNTNQPEICSYDHDIFNQRRTDLFNRCVQESRARNFNCIVGMPNSEQINQLDERTVFVWQFDLMHSEKLLRGIDQELTATGREIYVITDNLGTVPGFNRIKIFQRPEMMGVYAPVDDHMPMPQTPGRLFNCFMQRIDSVRQTWFYFLHHHNLMDRGYVSFLLKQLTEYSQLTGRELFDFIHQQYNLGQLPHFEVAYQHWRDKVPFRNFEENYDLPSLYQDSKYNVVLETYAVEDDHVFTVFNEKAIRALQMPSIPLLFVQRNGISLLQQLGFEVGQHQLEFDHLPWQQRQQHILNILIQDSIAYDTKMLYNQAIHNRELVTFFADQCAHQDFFSEILDQL
jgi:hypothetical protein